MIMLILLEGDVLQVETDAASTNVRVHVSYVDKNADGSVITAGRANTHLNSGADVYDVLSGPAAGVERNVQLITVSNDHAVDENNVNLIHNDGSIGAAFTAWPLDGGEARFWPDLGKDGIDGTNPGVVTFRANKAGVDQAYTASDALKITFTNEVFDVGGYYDAASSRFTPLQAGKYMVTCQAYFLQSSGVDKYAEVRIAKNGTSSPPDAAGFYWDPTASGPFGSVVAIIDFNGSTDYVEAFFASNSNGNIKGTAYYTFFQATLIGGAGPTGEPGEPGEAGDTGATGKSFHTGSGVPSNGMGLDGDTYLDVVTGRVYVKTAGDWGTHVATILVPGTNIVGGFTTTSVNAGTKSSGTFTPDPLLGNIQHYVNGGAHTLAPPSAPCTMVLQVTNASGGAITTSGFSLVTGDAIDTTGTRKHILQIVRTNSYSHLHVSAVLEGGETLPSPALNGFPIANGKLTLSAAAGALTAAIKTHQGNDPSAAFPVYVTVPDATGGYTVVTLTGAKSLVIPSGAEMGVAGTAIGFSLWFGCLIDGGTFRLTAKNCRVGAGWAPLPDGDLVTATAIGTGSDSAGVLYSDATVGTPTPHKILARAEWNASGLASLGTWTTTNLNRVTQHAPGSKVPGDVVQRLPSTYTARGTATNSTSFQNTNVLQAITPISAANGVRVSYTGGVGIGHGGANAGNAVNIRTQRDTGPTVITTFQLFAPGNGVNATYGHPVTFSPSRLDFPNKLGASETYRIMICSNNALTDVTLPYGNPGDVIGEFNVEEVVV